MLNKILLIVFSIVFIYIAVFTVYFAIIVSTCLLKSKKDSNIETDDYDVKKLHKNLIVVIYSHNNEKTIINLVEQLNKQDYPKANYQIHVILDNCSDDSSNKLEFVGGAKLWRLNDKAPLGRDKSISWLLENLMSFKKVDAYIFLNANRYVKSNFLKTINDSLDKHDVIVGSTEIYLEDADFYEKVWTNVNEYNASIMKQGRAKLGLAVPVDSDITVIKHKVLEKIQCIDFKDANSELKYTFLLTSVNYPPQFVPEVRTYVSSQDFELRRPTFMFKMSLFKHCFNLKTIFNAKFLELLFSLFKPNPIVLIALLVIVGVYSFNYYFLFDFPSIVLIAIVLAVAFILSVYKSSLYIEPLLYLCACPFYTIAAALSEVTIFKKFFKLKSRKEKVVVEKITVPVSVTNGRNIFPCSMDLISEGGFKKAVFRYKNKKQESAQSYVRMCDAVKNITDILEQHGFRMRICQSCAYFSPKIDGTNNMVKGYCNQKAVENPDFVESPETLLWNTCQYFIPQEVNNVIDISNYIKNKQ